MNQVSYQTLKLCVDEPDASPSRLYDRDLPTDRNKKKNICCYNINTKKLWNTSVNCDERQVDVQWPTLVPGWPMGPSIPGSPWRPPNPLGPGSPLSPLAPCSQKEKTCVWGWKWLVCKFCKVCQCVSSSLSVLCGLVDRQALGSPDRTLCNTEWKRTRKYESLWWNSMNMF